MRKKKHLEERLERVSDILFISDLDNRNFNTAVNLKEYINLDRWFGRSGELYLEIGCGKGGFSVKLALENPEINIIAVEKSANVIVEACEAAKRLGLNNIKFIKCSAEYLEKYLRPDSVGRIYLNFSCPFPKNKYETHRLTNSKFLKIYKNLMTENAEIHQKTDNMNFFEYSIEQFSLSGFILKNISLDLHNSSFENNIETEYEHKFSSQGFPIYRLEAYLREQEKNNG